MIVPLADCPAVLPVLAGWLHREWLQRWGLTEAEACDEMRGRLNTDAMPLAWVAQLGGRPVGTVSPVPDDPPVGPGRICCLSGLYVVPAWRRRGIGGRLCRHALAQARRLDCGPVGLYTDGHEEFYRRRGWTCETPAVIPGSDGPTLVRFMQPASFRRTHRGSENR